jgi:hypothetical protein
MLGSIAFITGCGGAGALDSPPSLHSHAPSRTRRDSDSHGERHPGAKRDSHPQHDARTWASPHSLSNTDSGPRNNCGSTARGGAASLRARQGSGGNGSRMD